MIEKAGVPLKAMILLGANCGFGQSDIANLPKSAINLEHGWLDFPRPKTGIERRAPLWPETIAALQDALAERPHPIDEADDDLVFITKYGRRWVRTTESEDDKKRGMSIDAVAQETRKLLNELGMKKGRLGFYALRHTFQTIGERSGDMPAVKHIMGHIDESMSGAYREGFEDDRLRVVVDAVRAWVFPPETQVEEPKGGEQG
jgi:integrase